MPNSKWLNKIVHRRKKARDEVTSTADPRQSTSPALEDSNLLQSPPTLTSSESTHPSLTTANSASVANDLLNSNNLPQQTASHDEPSTVQKGDNLGIRVLYEPSDGSAAIVDIIFVHGLTGNAYNTWFDEDRRTHWPSQLLKEDIPDARILSFGYDADVVRWFSATSVNRIGNHAEALLGALTRRRERTNSDHRKIIFVMHSLGGLVVRNALALSRSSPEVHLQKIEANTVGLAFLGTPHFGADLASWGGYGTRLLNIAKRTNKEIVRVLEPDSEMLATIQKRFHEILRLRQAMNQPIAVTCFHEELPFPILGMVSSQG
jgi:pimeloyl-ACP methyl ester carboxylesterase